MADQKFADRVVQHLPFLNRMVRGLMRGDSMADDIVQRTIVKALVHADQFRSKSTLKSWLASIAINEVHQIYRCAWRRRSIPLIPENVDLKCQHSESLSATYEAREREILVKQAVSCLPHSYRCIAELCELQSVPLKEVADRLHLTVSAVKTRRHRARKKLLPFVTKLNLSPSRPN